AHRGRACYANDTPRVPAFWLTVPRSPSTFCGMAVTDVTVDTRERADATTTTTTGYRAGIIGAGFMGGVHARAIRVNGGDVVGVVAGSADSSARAAESFLTRAYDSVDALRSEERRVGKGGRARGWLD